MRIGNCALCQATNVTLRDSHILPKCFYRRVRDATAANQNPMHIESGKKVQTSKQITQHLLCQDCEQKLANGCEAYVAREIAYQANGDCPLYKKLGYASTVTNVALPAPRHAVDCSSLQVQHLIDFAVSIFWRSAVASVSGTNSFTLPSQVSDLLRSYLLNHGHELGSIPITLSVLDQPRGLVANAFHRLFMVPGSHRANGYRLHGFLLCGLYFTMAEGSAIPPENFQCSLAHAKTPCLAFSVAANLKVLKNISDLARTT